jgi:hypothetical protein
MYWVINFFKKKVGATFAQFWEGLWSKEPWFFIHNIPNFLIEWFFGLHGFPPYTYLLLFQYVLMVILANHFPSSNWCNMVAHFGYIF